MSKTNGATKKSPASRMPEAGAELTIAPPNLQIVSFLLVGDAPYVQSTFSRPQIEAMRATQKAGSVAKGKSRKKEPKDFDRLFEESHYKAQDGGWFGIPSIAFKAAMKDACRLTGMAMTHVRQAISKIIPDGYATLGSKPLTRITKGEPEYHESIKTVANGAPDLRVRSMWAPGWETVVKIEYDADVFNPTDIANLLMRAGKQVGIGEGRMASPKSVGEGWGSFEIAGKK